MPVTADAGSRPQAGARNSTCISHTGGRNSSSQAINHWLSMCISRKPRKKQRCWDLNPGALLWEMCTPTGSLTSAPHTQIDISEATESNRGAVDAPSSCHTDKSKLSEGMSMHTHTPLHAVLSECNPVRHPLNQGNASSCWFICLTLPAFLLLRGQVLFLYTWHFLNGWLSGYLLVCLFIIFIKQTLRYY